MKKENKKEKKVLNKKRNSFFQEFRQFIERGNVMDLAVGVIMGNAFSKIVTSLTDNVLMPIVGVVIGGFDFTKLAYTFSLFGRTVDLKYGVFIQNTVDFLLTAFCIFLMIKVLNNLFHKKEEKKEEKEVVPKKAEDILLLEEIRDLLKEKEGKNKKTSSK